MNVAAAILLVFIVIPNAPKDTGSLSALGFPYWGVPWFHWDYTRHHWRHQGRKIADKVKKNVDEGRKTMDNHGERLMEHKKAINEFPMVDKKAANQTLTEGKVNADRWLSSNAEQQKGQAVVKMSRESSLGDKILDSHGLQPQPTIPDKEISPEPNVYPEEFEPTEVLTTPDPTAEGSTEFPEEKFEPTEVLTTPTAEESTEFPEESLENKGGDGLIIDKETPDKSDEETPQESGDGEYEEEEDMEPIIEEGEIEEKYKPEEAEKVESENDDRSEDESHQDSPLAFLRKGNHGKLGLILKKRAKTLLHQKAIFT